MTDTKRTMIVGGFMHGASIEALAKETGMKKHEIEDIIRKGLRS